MSPVSFVRLGWYFARRLLARWLLPRRGLRRFEASYGTEGLFALHPDEKDAVRALSQCIACGACDAHFTGYQHVARTALRAPSDLILGASRSLPDWDALVVPLAQLQRGDLAQLERICPARIPFAEVARVATKRARALAARSLAGGSSGSAMATIEKHDPG